ncbi:hypothetical protein J2T17_004684 [Paenibacillus mucilaginosus]|uniref:hypothetical protein n=1 Tax=Paenibacillus mucilaginosus TaxID=61624 RepID=UPI003D1D41C5
MTVLTESRPITAAEVYAAFREHFKTVGQPEIFREIREAFRNRKRANYRQHVLTPADHRLQIADDTAALAFRYYRERQPDGYVAQGYGLPARAPYLPTETERASLELLADYILADDHAAGLMGADRFREELDEYSLEYPPLGAGARAYQEAELNLLTADDMEHRKVCEVCRSYFIDISRANNAKRCGMRCTRRAEMIRKRTSRNGGDRRLSDMRRQQLEYPFYSPYELEHINSFPERCYKGETMDSVQSRNRAGGRKKPQGITMDSREVAVHHRPYNPRTEGESGPMVTKRRDPRVIERYLRMKGVIPRTNKHIGEKGNVSSSLIRAAV